METKPAIQIPLSNEQVSLVEKKMGQWASLGKSFAISEMEIANDVANLLKRIVIPTTIEDVPQAEAILKNLNSEKLRIIERRKETTSVLDSYIAKRMAPEKTITEPLAKLSEAIVALKTAHEKKQQEVELKAKEVVRIKEYLLNHVNSFDANCRTKIADLISASYKHALGAGNISTNDSLKEFLVKVEARITDKDFIYNPVMPKLVYNNDEEYSNFVADISIPTDYVSLFKEDLKKQFSDYEVAYHNKEKALELEKKAAAEKALAIEEDKKNKDIAAKLAAMAVPKAEVIVPGLKALKKSYVIDMEETIENRDKILGAFIANKVECDAKLGITKAFNLSVNNMIVALQKLKNDNNVFDVSGLIWKEVSK